MQKRGSALTTMVLSAILTFWHRCSLSQGETNCLGLLMERRKTVASRANCTERLVKGLSTFRKMRKICGRSLTLMHLLGPQRSMQLTRPKKHENALADMAYGEKKIRDEHDRDADVDHSIFQRRATKPTMLWTTKKKHSISSSTITDQPETEASAIENTTYKQLTVSESVSNPSTQIEISTEDEGSQRLGDQSRMQRQRNGMSLHEYLSKARATTK